MTTESTVNIVLAGVGGQGILLASEIVARAAMAAGYDVKTNEVHGMAQRGGSVLAQIRYGKKVNSPLVETGTAHVLASLERIESLRHADYLAPSGLAVVSQQMIVPLTVSSGSAKYPEDTVGRIRQVFPRLIYLDAVGIARDAGNIKASNTVIIGALSVGLNLPPESWHEAITQSVKEKFVEVNLRAFAAGVAKARETAAGEDVHPPLLP
jgi:indolepyruvate ferredoxin oxidoreductase, beta subunit